MRPRFAIAVVTALTAGCSVTGASADPAEQTRSLAAAAGIAPIAATGASASARKPGARRVRAPRVRKRPRRLRGHIPAWLLVADPFTTPAPGSPPTTGAPPAPAPVTPPPGTTPPVTPPPPTCGTAVGAREGEWFVTLSRATACAGTVTVEAQNYGSDPHDLRLQRENGPEVASWPELGPGSPGGVLAKKVTLAVGRYTLYCTLVGGTPAGTPGESHAAAGMTTTLTIVAP